MKMLRRGEMNPVFETLFRANCRIPDINMGDVHAMLGALRMAGRRVCRDLRTPWE